VAPRAWKYRGFIKENRGRETSRNRKADAAPNALPAPHKAPDDQAQGEFTTASERQIAPAGAPADAADEQAALSEGSESGEGETTKGATIMTEKFTAKDGSEWEEYSDIATPGEWRVIRRVKPKEETVPELRVGDLVIGRLTDNDRVIAAIVIEIGAFYTRIADTFKADQLFLKDWGTVSVIYRDGSKFWERKT
jgi:hypothetical protein